MNPATYFLIIEGTPGYSSKVRDITAGIHSECLKSSDVTRLKMAKSLVAQKVTGTPPVDHHVLSLHASTLQAFFVQSEFKQIGESSTVQVPSFSLSAL
jgi:hypothetical protein